MKAAAGLLVLLVCFSDLWAGPASDRPLTFREFLTSMNRVETQLDHLKSMTQWLTDEVSRITSSSPVQTREEVPSLPEVPKSLPEVPKSLPAPITIPIEETIFNLGLKMVHREPRNFAASPLSASILLNMLLTGTDGTTRNELQSALNLFHDENDLHTFYKMIMNQLKTNSQVKLKVGNGIFHRKPLKPTFESKMKEFFDGEVQQVDFCKDPNNAETIINNWVSKRTEGKLSQLFSSIPSDTEVVGVNTLYFKGDWQQTFQEQKTSNKPFYKSNSQIVNLPTMRGTFNIRFFDDKQLGFKMIALPFKGEQYAMYCLVPTGEDHLESLFQLESNLTSDILRQYIRRMRKTSIELFMPKFEIQSKIDLKELLKGMGVETLFRREANLSRMSYEPSAISDTTQMVIIEVTEKGAEALAATYYRSGRFRSGMSTPILKLDRPFMFFLMEEKTKVVLFSGHFVGSDL